MSSVCVKSNIKVLLYFIMFTFEVLWKRFSLQIDIFYFLCVSHTKLYQIKYEKMKQKVANNKDI